MSVPQSAATCIWMSAGVLNYKLCDRNHNCEHCPLDAALRGVAPECVPGSATATRHQPSGDSFPDDRRYTRGHTWVQRRDDDPRSLRIGLDRFAADHLPEVTRVRWSADSEALPAGHELCRLMFAGASLPLDCPLAISRYEPNPLLESEPGVIGSDPYQHGWVADLTPADSCQPEALELLDARRAARLASLESRRLRRCLAFHLLVHDDSRSSRSSQIENRLLDDLRRLLGLPRFLQLLGELVH